VTDIQRPTRFLPNIHKKGGKRRGNEVGVLIGVVSEPVAVAADEFGVEEALEVGEGRAAEVGFVGHASEEGHVPGVLEGAGHVVFGLFVFFGEDFVDDDAGDGDVVVFAEDAVELEFVEAGSWRWCVCVCVGLCVSGVCYGTASNR